MKPALVLLAAGASARLGRCKALVDLGGRTPLARLLAAGACLDAVPPLVVTGADREALAAAAPAGCELAWNPRWEQGRTGGVRLAHRLRPGRALCLAPVDVPLVPAEVFQALARKWEELGAPAAGWLAPCLEAPGRPDHGRHGHPVVLGEALLDTLEGLPASTSLRELRSSATPLAQVAVSAPEILDDLDRPADLERLRLRLAPR